jgi:hypothetical protein
VNRGSRGAAGPSHIASDRHHKEKVTCVCSMARMINTQESMTGLYCETRHVAFVIAAVE